MMMIVVVTTVTVEHSESVVGKHCIGHVGQYFKKIARLVGRLGQDPASLVGWGQEYGLVPFSKNANIVGRLGSGPASRPTGLM